MVGCAGLKQLFASPVGARGDALRVEVIGFIEVRLVGGADESSQHDRYAESMAITSDPVEPSDDQGASPADSDAPRVVAIHLAFASRMDMREVDTVEAEAGAGLVGDRYHGSKHRHVTVQSAEQLAEASELFGQPIEPGLTRRNITVSHGDIPTTPGERYTLGDVELEVVRVAAPCKLLEDDLGPGAKAALRRKAGTVFRCLSSGTIALGTPATAETTA